MSKAQCLDCEDILESKHRNDFVKCKCGNSFLDGGNDYFRGGGSLGPISDEAFYVAIDRDEALQKLLAEVEIDDMFDDDSFLDDDFDDYNLGYQAGTLDERERILHGIQKLEDQSHATRTPLYQDTMFAKIRSIVDGTT
jgi:hypothetical protein